MAGFSKGLPRRLRPFLHGRGLRGKGHPYRLGLRHLRRLCSACGHLLLPKHHCGLQLAHFRRKSWRNGLRHLDWRPLPVDGEDGVQGDLQPAPFWKTWRPFYWAQGSPHLCGNSDALLWGRAHHCAPHWDGSSCSKPLVRGTEQSLGLRQSRGDAWLPRSSLPVVAVAGMPSVGGLHLHGRGLPLHARGIWPGSVATAPPDSAYWQGEAAQSQLRSLLVLAQFRPRALASSALCPRLEWLGGSGLSPRRLHCRRALPPVLVGQTRSCLQVLALLLWQAADPRGCRSPRSGRS
mmetsp:Transcript_6230/g.13783  ORF Transcript_6230/g.13783 Transcript_6230/m.13783 type:complete len:292 (+) Transcript_6230:599-1474(+)